MPAVGGETTIRILLVDDNIDHVQLALRALKAEPDWHVETARTGAEALARTQEERYDILFLDYRLPDLTGLDVLQRVHAAPAPPAVFLMTSQGSEEVARKALSTGATGYVVKNHDFGRRLAYEVREWARARKGA